MTAWLLFTLLQNMDILRYNFLISSFQKKLTIFLSHRFFIALLLKKQYETNVWRKIKTFDAFVQLFRKTFFVADFFYNFWNTLFSKLMPSFWPSLLKWTKGLEVFMDVL